MDTGHPLALTAAAANAARFMYGPGSTGPANKDRYEVVAAEETPIALRMESGSFCRDSFRRGEVVTMEISPGALVESDSDGDRRKGFKENV